MATRWSPKLRRSTSWPTATQSVVSRLRQEWEYRASNAGWGTYDDMVQFIEIALSNGDFVLGDMFSMADVIFGGTLRYMSRFKMLDASPAVTAYIERLGARPALQRADAKNAALLDDRG